MQTIVDARKTPAHGVEVPLHGGVAVGLDDHPGAVFGERHARREAFQGDKKTVPPQKLPRRLACAG
jgi:hypothetical protein